MNYFRNIILTVIVWGTLLGCDDDKQSVTVFLLDSISILTPEQRERIKYKEFTHGRIIHELILSESKPNNFIVIDVDKIVRKRNEQTRQMEDAIAIDDHKFIKGLKRIDNYADRHPEKKIVVNMSFAGFRPLALELKSKNEKISERAEDDFSIREFKRKRDRVSDKLFRVKKDRYMLSVAEKGDTFIYLQTVEEEDRLIERLHDKGVVMVGAAGNDSTDDRYYPAAHPDVIAVAANDIRNRKTVYSNYGSYIDISAEGTYVKEHGASSSSVEGTSFAAPRVTALIVNIFKAVGKKDISPISFIRDYATPLSEEKLYNQDRFGAGAINPDPTLVAIDPSWGKSSVLKSVEAIFENIPRPEILILIIAVLGFILAVIIKKINASISPPKSPSLFERQPPADSYNSDVSSTIPQDDFPGIHEQDVMYPWIVNQGFALETGEQSENLNTSVKIIILSRESSPPPKVINWASKKNSMSSRNSGLPAKTTSIPSKGDTPLKNGNIPLSRVSVPPATSSTLPRPRGLSPIGTTNSPSDRFSSIASTSASPPPPPRPSTGAPPQKPLTLPNGARPSRLPQPPMMKPASFTVLSVKQNLKK